MKKIIYFLAALMAFTATSCNDDDVQFNNVEDLDRLPMPMFRRKYNTNVSDESDQFASKVMDGYRNAIQLHWYGVEGAAAYEIRYAVSLISENEETWRDPARNVTYVTVPADQLHYELYNLEYTTDYNFCIRALHPDGKEEHHSKWYGMGGGRQWEDYIGIRTLDRYKVPNVIDYRDTEENSFTLLINRNWDRSAYDSQDADTIEHRFNITNGMFGATHVVVKASPINPTAKVPENFSNYKLSTEDLTPDEDGFCRVTVSGLDQNSLYLVALRDDDNTVANAEVDRYYNYITVRTKGEPGPDIKIEHKVATSIWQDPNAESIDMDTEEKWFNAERDFQACRLDTVISNFNKDITKAEGQVFLLEGGKAYYLRQGPQLSKGFTLKTDPADILAGKGRAKVYMGGLYTDNAGGCVGACNWQLGKAKEPGEFDAPIRLDNVIFEDIDFDVPKAVNFGLVQETKAPITANYFANMLKTGLPIEFNSFQMRNCTFQGIIRGFFRIQGGNKRVINHVIIDNCVFFNIGYYKANGMDYGFIHGEAESTEENICGDLQITNNTFYDTTLSPIQPTKNKVNKDGFDANVHWNISIINNTFINSSTRAGNVLMNMREVPNGSTFTFKRNLICLARDANDKRNLDFRAIDIRNIHNGEEIHFDIRDNYSTGCEEKYLADDAIITNAGNRFSATKNAPGFWSDCLGTNTPDDLIVKVGSTPLYTTDLFQDPNPKYHAKEAGEHNSKMHYTDPETIWNRLQYKSDLKVTTHEIYTKNIGDQRWKTGDPKLFIPATAR